MKPPAAPRCKPRAVLKDLPLEPEEAMDRLGTERLTPPRNAGAERPEKPPRDAPRWAQTASANPITSSATAARRLMKTWYAVFYSSVCAILLVLQTGSR